MTNKPNEHMAFKKKSGLLFFLFIFFTKAQVYLTLMNSSKQDSVGDRLIHSVR